MAHGLAQPKSLVRKDFPGLRHCAKLLGALEKGFDLSAEAAARETAAWRPQSG
jgi:hypothetical protein